MFSLMIITVSSYTNRGQTYQVDEVLRWIARCKLSAFDMSWCMCLCTIIFTQGKAECGHSY